MKSINKELNGAWEERGVVGTRVEIDDKKITVLWRNAPVLETTFKTKTEGGGLKLVLSKNGLRYSGTFSDYAEITELKYDDGQLEMTEYFPISGESKATLSKTENSRYGNYDIVDSVLNELQGKWQDEEGYFELEFHKDEMILNGRKTKIHVLRSKDGQDHRYLIADADPSVYELQGFSSFSFDGRTIAGLMTILDAPAPKIVIFSKIAMNANQTNSGFAG